MSGARSTRAALRWLVTLSALLLALTTSVPSRTVAAEEGVPAISAESPRVWPAADLPNGLMLGAADAFMAPERAIEADVRWSRQVFSWRELQVKGPDDWSGYWLEYSGEESQIDVELKAGRRVVGLLARTPAWAAPTGDPAEPPKNLYLPFDHQENYWARWVERVVERYAGRIDDWVIWNEPDVWSNETHSIQWKGTVQDYYQLQKTAYLAAKRVKPYSRVWLAGLTYWWDYLYGREQYFAQYLRIASQDPTAAENRWYFDGAVLQLYNNPRSTFDVPRVYRRIMDQFGVSPAKPIWLNEFNVVPWDDPVAPLSRDHYRATMEEQAHYLLQSVAYGLAGGLDYQAFFKWVDDPGIKKGVEQAFGLLRNDPERSARPAFHAFRAAQQWLAPTTRAQLVDEGPVAKVYLEQPRLGRRVTATWNHSGVPQETVIRPLGESLELRDVYGALLPVPDPDEDGLIRLTLGPATANTLPGFPDAFFIGGPPVLVVEDLPEEYAPLVASSSLPLPPLTIDE